MLVRTHHTKCTNMSAGSGVERGCSGQDAHWSPSWDNSNVLKPLTSATTSCGSMRWTNRMPKSREWWVGWLASCSLRRKGGETRGSKGGWGGEKGEVRREKWGGRSEEGEKRGGLTAVTGTEELFAMLGLSPIALFVHECLHQVLYLVSISSWIFNCSFALLC